jgi:signal transduction histidine kinase
MFPSSLYESVFKSSPIGCYLLSTTPEITILDVNDSFLHNVSLTRDDMIGKGLFEVFPDNPDDPKDTGVEALRRSIALAVETGKPQFMPIQRFPIQRELPNGVVVFEERFWSASNTPIFDQDGKMACIYHATVEITKQVQAETALRKSELQAIEAARQADAERHRLDAVLEAAPVGIAVADANGALQLINPKNKQIWGVTLPLSKNVDEYQEWKGWWADGSPRHGRRVEPYEWPLARALAGEEAPYAIVEIEPFDPPSLRRIVYVSGAPIKNREGRIDGALCAVMDITDRIKAEQELKEADRRKDEFLAMLAHELRNPLAPIAAAADLLELVHLDGDRVKQTSAIVSRQVKHMAGLVDDLLDVSRVTRGLVSLVKERLDVKRILADAVEQVRPFIEAANHGLTVHTPPESAFVLGDKKRLVQVLTNLLTNAAKYTPAGGEITLSMEVDSVHVKVSIADNGVGMDATLLQRAFELFAQAERAADRSQGGLGIGLALVKSLVELHGGSVTAYSDGLGKGSRFIVCLPHLKEHTEVSDSADSPTIDATAVKPLKVMVVDDNTDAAQMMSMLLGALGHQVVVEHSSKRALERARVERPHVFLLDIGLPDLDGNELARRLRAQPETANAILVAVTGYGQEQDRKNALSAGFDHHFVKPIDIAKVATVLREIDPS